MTCAKCSGLVAERYDTALREHERYCIQCGYMPDLVCRREDGADRGEELLCVKCRVAPRHTITGHYGKVKNDTQLRYCVGCRVEHAERMRAHQNKMRNASGRKSGLGNLRVRRLVV